MYSITLLQVALLLEFNVIKLHNPGKDEKNLSSHVDFS